MSFHSLASGESPPVMNSQKSNMLLHKKERKPQLCPTPQET
jgi:hypothetical protein